jgi:hypothetical protein
MPVVSFVRGPSGRRFPSLLPGRHARGALLAPLFATLALALPVPRLLQAQAAGSAPPAAAPAATSTPATSTPATPASSAGAAAPARADSALAPLARAQQAQAQFEITHRKLLRLWRGSPGPCEVKVGDLCYWNNNLDEPAPEERPSVAVERARLLGVLAQAQAAAPTEDWIVGQRVRYLVEAGKSDSAVTVARECRASAWWCAALRGYALHATERYVPALAAFDSATRALPAKERCEWDDVGAWLDVRTRDALQRAGCGTPARAALSRRLWTLVQPLWTLGADDLRSEWNARRVSARMHANSANAYGLPWAGPTAEVELRFGWATAWSLGNVPVDTVRGPWNVVGHEPTPSFAFFPNDERLAGALTGSVAALPANAYSLYAGGVRMRYAPRWARTGFLELDAVRAVQVARFRRGDTSVVAASWSLGRDTTGFEGAGRWQVKPLRAAFLLLDDSLARTATATLAEARPRGALVVREPARSVDGLGCTAWSCAPTACGGPRAAAAPCSRSPPTPPSPTCCSSPRASRPTRGSRRCCRRCTAAPPSGRARPWGSTGSSTAGPPRTARTRSPCRPPASPSRPARSSRASSASTSFSVPSGCAWSIAAAQTGTRAGRSPWPGPRYRPATTAWISS